jgi:integrase
MNLNHTQSDENNYFFIGTTKYHLTRSNVDRVFHEIRWKANIPYTDIDKQSNSTFGSRVHDFRHSFAVNCLHKWILEKKDLHAYLPVLQAYLGHSCLKDTAYYLHLTLEQFPDLLSTLNHNHGDIIPQLTEKNHDQ